MNTKSGRISATILFLFALPLLSFAQYKAERNGDVVHLTDTAHQTSVAIDSAFGNVVFEMTVKGQNIIYFPSGSPEEFKAHPRFEGIPVLSPWANRLDEQAFYANGKKYTFNMTLGNVRGATPIHGLVSQATSWEITELKADKNSAWVTARLDFYKHPDWMAQFPFAHSLIITQKLHDGVLEVHTRIDNLSSDPMPVAIGFHPYFRLTDSARDDWKISVAAKSHYLLQPTKIPSGETEPIASFFKDSNAADLKDYNLDDVFGDLTRNSQGRAAFSVSGKNQKVTVEFGPKFQAAVIFSPNPKNAPPRPANAPAQDPNFICFEPMAAITDAMNLQHAGKYSTLESIAPGGTWEESFWITPSGF
jgi:aldose 1-epimerase